MDSLTLLLVYASIEALFYLIFTYYLVPRANRRTEPHEYREYLHISDRHRLLLRILDRMERTCRSTNQNFRHVLQRFLEQWFHHHTPDLSKNPPPLRRVSLSSSSSSASSPETSDEDESQDWTMSNDLGKQDADTFLSWAFFGKHYQDLTTWEHVELDKFFTILRERYNMVFKTCKSSTKTARLLTLEDVNPLHRPLLLYVIIGSFNILAGIMLSVIGFRRHVTKAGLVYWHRGCDKSDRLPLLFFHGIAPGGLTFYLPMVLGGIGMDGRSCFLFENRPISCSICFRAFSEKETVAGVLEALETHVDSHTNVSLIGHSFGSCSITWLLHSPLRNRIKQVVLLDPVTILLSEPDVMNNFLYSRQVQSRPNKGLTKLETIRQSIGRTKIRLLASSELFTEYYLRRHFSWYNSELWLDDIPCGVQVAVCLAENDEIINAEKVKQEVTLHNEHSESQVNLVYWEGVGHARCVTSIREWAQIRNIMLKQEATIDKEDSC